MFVRKPVVRVATRATEMVRKPKRSLIPWAVGLAALFVAALLIRAPGLVSATAHCVSAEREVVRADGPGRVAAVFVRQGDRVLPHQVVAILVNDSVAVALQAAQGNARESVIEAARAQRGFDPRVYQEAIDRHQAALAQETMLGDARSRLALASRGGGVVLTPRPSDRLGARLEQGDTLLVLAAAGTPEIECDLQERDVGDVTAGSPVTVRFHADPGRKLDARIERVFSVSALGPGEGPHFKALARLEGSPDGLRLGESGVARIEVGRWNAFERLHRAWVRFVREDLWL